MTRTSLVVAGALLVGWIAGGRITTLTAQSSPSLPGQGIPRCDIPKEFGRMVTFISGAETGLTGQVTSKSANGNVLAGQAIFEAADGTIRWVAVVAPANAGGTDKPALRVMPRNFPVLPIYECAIAHVWLRP
jgi:hypothetical protein